MLKLCFSWTIRSLNYLHFNELILVEPCQIPPKKNNLRINSSKKKERERIKKVKIDYTDPIAQIPKNLKINHRIPRFNQIEKIM